MGLRFDANGELVNDAGEPATPSIGDPVAEPVEAPAGTFDDDASDGPLCEVCGEPIAYSGRGRRPKYHPEHRPTAPKRSASAPARGTGAIRNEAALRQALLGRYMQLGGLLAMLHPAYGMGVKQKAEEAVEADIEYARVSPAFRRSLEAMLEKTALGAVIAVHAAMVAPVVIGERAKAARKKAAQPAKPPVSVRQPTQQRPPTPEPTPPSDNVYHMGFPSTESDVAPESVNAGAMPGMPG